MTTLLALVDERVEVSHERLHFGRIVAFDARRVAVPHRGQLRAQAIERRQTTAQLRESGDRAGAGNRAQHRVVGEARPVRHPVDHLSRDCDRNRHDAHGPEQRPDDKTRPQRAQGHQTIR